MRVDVDGDGSADAEIVLIGRFTLTAGDFVLQTTPEAGPSRRGHWRRQDMPVRDQGTGAKLRAQVRKVQRWVLRHVPPGLRLVLGLVLIVGGVFGFLPILGFWMIPLGIGVAALDIRPLIRRLRKWRR